MIRLLGPIVLILAVFALVASEAAASAGTSCPVGVQEDSPQWDWTVCGNGTRGIYVKRGTRKVGAIHPDGRPLHRVVTRAQFKRATIDWTRTEPLRGDPSPSA